ncbi:MAG TPA: LuxR C-terminal-related transcriptional regulator [Steroidobacteraceae bacterium]|nr:LuxR C-terminal-related transcriptional regulator [Steroidobacteraceae bacterium]
MQKLLLTSKLTTPTVSRYSVDRTEICSRVFLAFGSKVVLIRAPAGFGKTTVMAQLWERYRKEGTAVAWLNLDEADNDLPRFLSYLLVALRGHLRPDPALEDMDAQLSFDTGYVTTVVANQLGQSDTPFVMFLDEVDVIRDPTVLAFVKQMIARLPQNARLVLGSRTFPEIGLGRLRAHGELFEVTPEQLRFSPDEASLFLTQRRGLSLRPEQVQRLVRSTEGWPTALWLASVALERRTNTEDLMSGFAGSATAVAEYLADDVMAGQPPDVRDFLLKTSVLSQFGASLCDAVCGRTDSAELLPRLERQGLFLTVVDEQQHLYRYHSLFRDFLRTQLYKTARETVPVLHRAAADWFLAADRPVPAIEHALATRDLGYVMPLLEQNAEILLNQGRLRMLTRWLETFPAPVKASPNLRLMHIWAVNLTRGPQEALTLVEKIDPVELGTGAALAQYHAMQPTLLAMRDRIDESFSLGLERIQILKPEHAFPYAILSQTLAVDSMILGNYSEARRYVDQARAAHSGRASSLQVGLAGSINATIDLIQGRLKQALAELRLAAGVSGDDLFQSGNRNLLSGVLLAEALYESGELKQAEGLLTLFLPLAQTLGLPDQLIVAHSLLSKIVEQQNDPDRSLEVLTQLELLGHRLGLHRVIASARIEKSAALLIRGDSAAAGEQLDLAAAAVNWEEVTSRSYIANDKVTLSIGRVRWMIRSGEAAAALPIIKKELAIALAGQRNRRALKLRILQAEALEIDGQHKLAMRTLLRATESSAQEGFVSIFHEEGERIQEMLRGVLNYRQAEDGHGDGDPLNAYLTKMTRSRSPTSSESTPPVAPDETLTRKELQIVDLLAQGFSNDAMAEKLFVSESTVRTHLRSINTKLRASNRVHALAIARQRHLVQ